MEFKVGDRVRALNPECRLFSRDIKANDIGVIKELNGIEFAIVFKTDRGYITQWISSDFDEHMKKMEYRNL
jgi:hypothetical protein